MASDRQGPCLDRGAERSLLTPKPRNTKHFSAVSKANRTVQNCDSKGKTKKTHGVVVGFELIYTANHSEVLHWCEAVKELQSLFSGSKNI